MKAIQISQGAIARACGVNLTTVALALNHHPRVRERTRLRIEAAAQRLGYEPNHAARNLARRRYHRFTRLVDRVGLVLYSPAEEMLKSVYLAFLLGAEKRVAELGGSLLFLREASTTPDSRLVSLARSGTVDGLILAGDVTDQAVLQATTAKIPFVVLGDYHGSLPVHQANGDYRAMGRLAVQHLLALGHRRIGFLADRLAFAYQRETAAGAQAAMADTGLTLQLEDWSTGQAPDAINRTPRSPIDDFHATGTTALIVGEPGRAGDFLASLTRRGLRVPQDLSLVACEVSDSRPVTPGIAHVDVLMVDAAAAAVDLLRQVTAEPGGPIRTKLIAPRLIEGPSARRLT